MPHQADFLHRILPPLRQAGLTELQPCYYLFGLDSNKIPHPVPFLRIEDVPVLCQTRLAGMDTYIAPAVYKDSCFGRKAVNVLEVKSLWLDIDVGKANNSYATFDEACNALQGFIAVTGLIPTVLVSSGVGLQVYYTFTHAISVAAWKQLSQLFATVCTAKGLIVDPACTTDAARVLRLPGTVHTKSGNIAQVIGDKGKDWEPKAFLSILARSLPPDTRLAPQVPITQVPDAVAQQTMIKQPLIAKAEPIVKQCKCVLTAGLCSEPQWFGMMGVLRSCVDGLEWAHKLSALDKARYVPEDTERKFYHAAENAPTRCSTFAAIAPDLCGACPHRGTITSPIQLASKPMPEPAPEPVPQSPTEHLNIPEKFTYELKPLRDVGYVVDDRGIVMIKGKVNSDGAWESEEQILTDSKIYYSHTVYDNIDGYPQRTHMFVVETRKGRELVPFSIERDMTTQRILRWFYNANVFFYRTPKPEHLVGFMERYLKVVAEASPEVKTMKRFGWNKFYDPVLKTEVDGFVTGAGIITETGLHHVRHGDVAERIASQEMTHKGSLEKWKYIPQMYKTLDQKAAQFAMCLAFAAPLMRYAPGIATSGIFSLWSTASGMGKSQVMRACASVWGDPDNQFIQRNSSQVLRQRKLSTLNNLPCYMDELTDVPDDDLYALAYTLVDGREKQKLKSSGAEMVETGDWKTITFTTANKSFKEAAARVAGDSDASLLRVVEVECDFKSYEDNPAVNQYIHACIDACRDHYGLAGPEFMFQIMKHRDRLATIAKRVEAWAQKHGFKNNERYIYSQCGVALIVGRWCVEWGLLDYDMDALEEYVLSVLVPHNRKMTQANAVKHDEMLRSYIIDRQLHTLIVNGHERLAEEAPAIGGRGAPDKYIVSYPNREVTVRMEMQEGDVYISAHDFTQWCTRHGLSDKVTLRALTRSGIDWETVNQCLTDHIAWAITPPIRAYRIRLDDLDALKNTIIAGTARG